MQAATPSNWRELGPTEPMKEHFRIEREADGSDFTLKTGANQADWLQTESGERRGWDLGAGKCSLDASRGSLVGPIARLGMLECLDQVYR